MTCIVIIIHVLPSVVIGESPLRMENLAPGPHRVVVIPKGCGRNRKTGSVRFMVE